MHASFCIVFQKEQSSNIIQLQVSDYYLELKAQAAEFFKRTFLVL